MSAASLRVLRGQIERGVAGLETIDTWQAKKLLTTAEADEARAYWHQLYDPPPPPPEPVSEPEPTPADVPVGEAAPTPETATERPAETPAAQPADEPPAGG